MLKSLNDRGIYQSKISTMSSQLHSNLKQLANSEAEVKICPIIKHNMPIKKNLNFLKRWLYLILNRKVVFEKTNWSFNKGVIR